MITKKARHGPYKWDYWLLSGVYDYNDALDYEQMWPFNGEVLDGIELYNMIYNTKYKLSRDYKSKKPIKTDTLITTPDDWDNQNEAEFIYLTQ